MGNIGWVLWATMVDYNQQQNSNYHSLIGFFGSQLKLRNPEFPNFNHPMVVVSASVAISYMAISAICRVPPATHLVCHFACGMVSCIPAATLQEKQSHHWPVTSSIRSFPTSVSTAKFNSGTIVLPLRFWAVLGARQWVAVMATSLILVNCQPQMVLTGCTLSWYPCKTTILG